MWIPPGKLKQEERQTTRGMGFSQEEESSPGTHGIIHIRAPKHGSHECTQGICRAKTPEQLKTLLRMPKKSTVERDRAAPQEIQSVE